MTTKEEIASTTNTSTVVDSDDKIKYEILPDDYTQYDLSFKIIVIGDCGVGKSCLSIKATSNVFDNTYNATVGFEFFTFNIKINDIIVKLQIWDTCGQEVYRSLITNFYRNSSLCIVVYSIDSKRSFEGIEMWLKELRTFSSPDAKIFLIANKVDLENKREVTKEEGEAFMKQNKMDLFMEASAKTGINVQEIFIRAAKMLYLNHLKYKDNPHPNNNNNAGQPNKKMALTNKRIDNKKKNTGGCC